jgi:preprotein translocase subunit SecA
LETLRVFYSYLYNKIYKEWETENRIVKDLGGLFVLGTERHETRRIDNQLRGRAGRQGDPGNSQFFISLEDELIKVFGGDSIKRWVEYLIQDKDVPLESDLLTKSLENAQKKVELYNYDLRKNVFQYDDILNTQRKQLFQARNQMLSKNIYHELFLRYAEYSLDEEITTLKPNFKEKFFYKIEKYFGGYSSYLSNKNESKKENNFENQKHFYSEIWISNDLRFAESNFYQVGFLKSTRATVLLSIIDFYWTEHIERMNYIRETINWRSYGQQTPLVEYNMEAFKSFKLMFEQIRSCMIYYFLSNPIN